MLQLFQDNFIFRETTSSHFFKVATFGKTATFSEELFFLSSCFFLLFRTATFSQQLFLQNSFFFRAKILQNSHVLRIRSPLWQLLSGKAIFSLFRIKISKKELLFQSKYCCTVSTFSEKLYFGKS